MIITNRPALDALRDRLPRRPFLRAQARLDGIPKEWLTDLERAGYLRQPLRGVLVPAGCGDNAEDRAAAVRLVLPPGAALCRGTAAWLLGVDARPPSGHGLPPPTECAVPRDRTPVRRAGVTCYVTDLTGEDVTEVAGLPCTTRERTAIDLARYSMPGTGLAVLDRMARLGLVDPGDLADRIERWRGDRFVARARQLIRWCDPRAESPGESWLRLRLLDAGFPAPDLQISLTDDRGAERYRLDLGYRRQRWACEYDGEEFHDGPAAEHADQDRRETIDRGWGWTVVGVRKNLVLGPSMALEKAVGEVLGIEPRLRRRPW